METEFYNGTKDFILPNGDSYSGEYCAHVSGLIWREGQGIYKTQDGQTYEGLWRDDKLVAGPDVKLKYIDGSVYEGPIAKNKYLGSGSYTLPSGLKMYSNFDNNLPQDEIMMADLDGRIWHGFVDKKTVNFSPENKFFSSIPKHRGLRKDQLKQLAPDFIFDESLEEASEEASQEVRAEELIQPDWQAIVFAKSRKTNDIIDFNDSPWCKEYIRYKRMREVVLEKVRTHEKLDEEEAKWYEMYVGYRRMKRLKFEKAEKLKAVKVKPVTDTSLLDRFYSRRFAESSKPYKVFYPTSVTPESERSEENQDEMSSVEFVLPVFYPDEEEHEETGELEQEESIETIDTVEQVALVEDVALGTDSLYDYLDEVLQTKIVRVCDSV